MSVSIALTVLIASLLYVSLSAWSKKRRLPPLHPPIVDIPDEALYRDPRSTYENALKENGPIIAAYRKNRLEIIVSHAFAAEVLTNDDRFSFEEGTLAILNLEPLLYFHRSFLRDLEQLVNENITAVLERVVGEVSPILESNIRELTDLTNSADGLTVVDFPSAIHRTMTKVMLTIIFGKNYTSPTDVGSTEKLVEAIAVLSGIYQNTDYWSRTFATTWRIVTWIRIVFFELPWNFTSIGWRYWKDVRAFSSEGSNSQMTEDSLMHCMAKNYAKKTDGRVSVADTIWMMVLSLGLVFASVHQTSIISIWVLYQLARRPECISAIRTELKNIVEEDPVDGKLNITYSSLKNADYLDSFIREVLRTKGDTLAVIRRTTCDVPLGGYILPKGSLVIPLATLSHFNTNEHGDDANEFIGGRWVGSGKLAVTVGPNYWPFGLGHFVCPGRTLAVAEIKLILLHLLARATPTLEDNSFEVIDPQNITAVPPVGRLYLTPWTD
ncbi:cytochrome P450 [Fistulina hepatica ATCC 64428]|uniref:Cytochrome P450 n=1 Tax=Fistulina hepatica ATCC 64428 TaxID=1128425 RepID=A0A0D7AQL3_9AGAR|nr:cytochrome P450 [Fistulina hepatica ATCC 64428]